MHLKHLTLAASTFAAAYAQSLNATLAGNPQLSNLTSYLSLYPQLATQISSIPNITILAPDNNAFAQLLSSSAAMQLSSDPSLIQALLTYHVLNGTYTSEEIMSTPAFIPTLLTNMSYSGVTGGQRVEAVSNDNTTYFFSGLLQNSTVTQANLNFTNGVIHIISNFLTLPQTISSSALATGLTALVGALNTTSLASAVDTTPDLTVFAPNNEAFQSISSALSNLTTQEIASVLQYHVVNGSVPYYSSMLANGTMLTAMSGGNLTVRMEGEDLFVNGARVVTPDVLVANGVVHVIDEVLNPLNATASPTPSATAGAPGFTGTASGTDIPYTSGVPSATTTVDTSAGAGAGAGATGTGAGGAGASSSSSGAAVPVRTGAVGQAVLFGMGAVVVGGGW